MLPHWFNLALDARIHREHLYRVLSQHYRGYEFREDEFDHHRHESVQFAFQAGYSAPMISMPLLLAGDDELEEFFRSGQDKWRQEQEEELEDQRKAVIEQKIESKDWIELGLPQPHELLADLKSGKKCEVNGHSLSPGKDGVWVTNPYGHDCDLWQDIDLEFIENFLADMARDEEYGPVPY